MENILDFFSNSSKIAATAAVLGTAWVVSLVCQAIWRLYFSPIAKFPGPKLAALTYWYEFYYDIIQPGQYLYKIQALHEIYGPVIRINPEELHVADRDFFPVLFAGGSHKRERVPFHARGLALQDSVLTTISHDLHRRRRAGISSFFSMQSTRKLLPLVKERVDKLVERLGGLRGSGTVVNLEYAYSALTNDVVMEYCLGESDHRIEADGFDPSYYIESKTTASSVKLFSHMPWLPKLVLSLPDRISAYLGPGLADFVNLQKFFRVKIAENKEAARTGKPLRDNLFSTVLASSLPESEKSDARMVNEAIAIIGAGSHTVSWTLTIATYHILANPSIFSTLTAELRSARTALPPATPIAHVLTHLEKLPYLTATLKEALRFSYGVSIRLARAAPDEDLVCGAWSMTHALLHHDEGVFADSWAFAPERWLGPGAAALDAYLVSFSGGSRVCLGMNLAWAEMYLCLAAVFQRFDGEAGRMRLFETTERDVRLARDFFLPEVAVGSKGVRVLVE